VRGRKEESESRRLRTRALMLLQESNQPTNQSEVSFYNNVNVSNQLTLFYPIDKKNVFFWFLFSIFSCFLGSTVTHFPLHRMEGGHASPLKPPLRGGCAVGLQGVLVAPWWGCSTA
jgi:hypothetical protein